MNSNLQDKLALLASTQTRSESIYANPEGWIIKYPQFSDLADEQMHSFWPWDEPDVSADLQDLKVYATPAELHGILEVLKLFTHYERKAGDDYWSGRILKTFKRPEIQRMASMFASVEMNSHAPFYNKINEVLFVDTEEFYSSWKLDPVLADRMAFLDQVVNAEDDLVSIGSFTFIEGGVLYSSFGYLKHFQVQECGKDLIRNICRGINLSAGDENGHAVGGAALFQAILSERNLSANEKETLQSILREVAIKCSEHEFHIIEQIFSKGNIKGLTAKNMVDFVKHRINLCLANLGCPPLFNESELDGFVASWFYSNINSVQFHDIFTGSGSEYHIDWKEEKFGNVWKESV